MACKKCDKTPNIFLITIRITEIRLCKGQPRFYKLILKPAKLSCQGAISLFAMEIMMIMITMPSGLCSALGDKAV